MDTDLFKIRVQVRVYEVDTQRHLAGACYVQYAEHTRFACMQAAGVSVHDLLQDDVGPVNLQTTIRYHKELVMGDELDIFCSWKWHGGKTFEVDHAFRRGADGELAAELTHVSGLLDLQQRRLLSDPAHELRRRAHSPRLLGLDERRQEV